LIKRFGLNLKYDKELQFSDDIELSLTNGRYNLMAIETDWFTIELPDDTTYCISEYKHWQETHCYLLIGNDKCSVIDTGLGIANIKNIIPIIIIKIVAMKSDKITIFLAFLVLSSPRLIPTRVAVATPKPIAGI